MRLTHGSKYKTGAEVQISVWKIVKLTAGTAFADSLNGVFYGQKDATHRRVFAIRGETRQRKMRLFPSHAWTHLLRPGRIGYPDAVSHREAATGWISLQIANGVWN
ncbi:hypothetical protein CJU94_26515 [Paraburkholderia aromaticivorans]|uniref:Uncharacterized protein n=1 Tax=Paraburkholderia aromaticivorans TaxID=2026199 RepID=A0A248VRN7_9BURK|nr:hypothetical protein CJU94_26515 [Paraburkholderia aromaticivorans]